MRASLSDAGKQCADAITHRSQKSADQRSKFRLWGLRVEKGREPGTYHSKCMKKTVFVDMNSRVRRTDLMRADDMRVAVSVGADDFGSTLVRGWRAPARTGPLGCAGDGPGCSLSELFKYKQYITCLFVSIIPIRPTK